MTRRTFAGPGAYIQNRGEIIRLGRHAAELGGRALALIDRAVDAPYRGTISASFAAAGAGLTAEVFGGESSWPEVERGVAAVQAAGADLVVGVGGGKTIDAAKLIAHEAGLRLIIVPTIASTDAPCSAIAALYSPDGAFERSVRLPHHPDIVIVDPEVIVRAPLRFLVAGIGDALSTWPEARAAHAAHAANYAAGGGAATLAGLAIARQCHETILAEAIPAVEAARQGRITPALEHVIEANTLLSGLGFENCGCAAAHGLHNGLTLLEEAHHMMHGEKVAFGVLCQLILEARPWEEIAATGRLCRAIGLPTSLAEMGLAGIDDTRLQVAANGALAERQPTFNSIPEPGTDTLVDAIRAADALSHRF